MLTTIQMLQKYGTIEQIPDLKDITVLKVDECRSLFTIQYEQIVTAG